MKEVDARGRSCPEPLIMTRKGLTGIGLNEKMRVLIDNETSKINVERFLKDNGMEVTFTEKDGVFELTVIKSKEDMTSTKVEEYCVLPTERIGNYSFVFKTSRVADDELGEILTAGFFGTIGELDLLPRKIILYHKGIDLALDDSPVVNNLKDLEAMGVEVVLCGTCVDHYEVKERVAAGKISNAYDILTALAEADHLVYP
ncbi:MAG: sulfurtransferase-like selenium metabolism protein YedF [Bacteroidales bacterium]|nr:sulfurtransferase-like selenium metabolism protein YedF [Candidatus Latescibacterota bacterium]